MTANEANLAFYSAGTVQQVLVKIGDNVTAGQALAKLDTAPLESNLAQAEINVETAQMNLENAEEPQTNSSGTVISAPDPLNIEIKQLQLQNAQANQAEAQKELDRATITAPFAGLVTNVNVVPGDQVAANFVGVRIIDPVNFQVVVLVNEMEIYNLSIGTPATVQAVALPTYTFPGKVSLIAEAPTIQSNVVNYQVTVQMDPVTAATLQAQSTSRTSAGTTSARTRPSGTGGQTSNAQTAANLQSDNQTASDNRTFYRQTSSGQQSDNQTAAGPNSTRRSFAGQSAGAGGQNQQAQAATTVPADFRLREGLTVTVSIVTEQKTNILLVPNKAITSQGGRYYVQVVSAGTDHPENDTDGHHRRPEYGGRQRPQRRGRGIYCDQHCRHDHNNQLSTTEGADPSIRSPESAYPLQDDRIARHPKNISDRGQAAPGIKRRKFHHRKRGAGRHYGTFRIREINHPESSGLPGRADFRQLHISTARK